VWLPPSVPRSIQPEITVASPMSGLRLLLVRSCAVHATTLVAAGAMSLTLPGLDWTAAAWVLPSFALTLAALALSTVFRPEPAAVTVAVVWVASVLGSGYRAGDWLAAFGTTGQLAFGVVILLAAMVVFLRRFTFEMGAHL